WFHKPETPTIVLLTQKNGPNQLKQSIENHYSRKNFRESLRLSLEFIEFVENCNTKVSSDGERKQDPYSNPNKLTSTRDMLEIAARSALRLGNVEIAVKCVDKLVSNEPGHIYFRGMVYAKGGRYADSIRHLIKYNQMRKNDYKTWKEIGNTFLSCYHTLFAKKDSEQFPIYKPDTTLKNTFITQISLLSFHRALNIMTISEWSDSVSFVYSRFTREKAKIERLINDLEEEGVVKEEAYVFGGSDEPDSKIDLEKLGFEGEMIKYILMECRASVNSERMAEEQEKSAGQL
ncbi:18634_t:CDS:2, partial [Acaulospora morrowiae]